MTPDATAAGRAEERPREKEPRRTSSFTDGVFVFDQKIEQTHWRLLYDYKKCNGCGLCVEVCPTLCMELGNVPEIASGLDAPAVLIDGDECCFCGMCAGLCPLHALEFTVNGEDYRNVDGRYPHLAGNVEVDEKCLPCIICAEGCPTESIKLDLNLPAKEELAPFNPDAAKGSIRIDMEKCTLCGLCARFCEALVLLENEPKGPDQMPFEGLAVDEERCDYCGLCVPLCPEDAIAVEGDIVEKDVEWSGEITVNHETCIRCGRCQEICPYDAIHVEKFLEGRIDIIPSLLDKCDPTGCVACFAACPTDAWYVPDEGVIAVNEKVCNYCGGCQEACRYLIIEVHRDVIRTTPLEESSWREQWTRAMNALTGGDRGLSRPPRVQVEAEDAGEVIPAEEVPEVLTAPASVKRRADEALGRIKKVLGNIKVRYLWERDAPGAADEMAGRLKKEGTKEVPSVKKRPVARKKKRD